MKVLITGIAGFAGSHLAELALREGAEVVGTVLPGTPTDNLASVHKDVATVDCDLTESGAAAQVLRGTRPDRVFHLAGASVVGTSWALRADVLRTNLEATYQLCEGLRRHPVPCLIVSSGEVYGVVPEEEQPISEARRWAPGSPYALSKASQELYAGYYVRSESLPLVIVRAFNHVGPRQGLGFVWSDVARLAKTWPSVVSGTKMSATPGGPAATFSALNPYLSWNPVPGAKSYDVEVATGDQFNNVVFAGRNLSQPFSTPGVVGAAARDRAFARRSRPKISCARSRANGPRASRPPRTARSSKN